MYRINCDQLKFLITTRDMKEVRLFLCPHVKMEKTVARAEVLKEQLKRVLPQLCVEIETRSTLVCPICLITVKV